MTITIVGALLIGITLGLLGSGGSTITVPILVYLVGHDAKISIAESMAIVGLISAVGAITFARSKQVDWTSVMLFGIPAMFGTFIGAYLGGLSSDAVQLLVFGVVLLLAAGIMVRKAFGQPRVDAASKESQHHRPEGLSRYFLVLVEGTVVGALTGFVGVGGGFLIVPALLILGKLPMRMAVGTSLVIIVMKSTIGFAKYHQYLAEHGMSVDWKTIIIFSLIGLLGCSFGQLVNRHLNQRALMQIFAVFLILVGGYVVTKEGSKVVGGPPAGSTRTEAVSMDGRLEKAWAKILKDFDDSITNRIEEQQAVGLIKPFEARPVAMALNRMDAYLLIHHFGRRPRGNRASVREAILRVWSSTLYGDNALADSVSGRRVTDAKTSKPKSTLTH